MIIKDACFSIRHLMNPRFTKNSNSSASLPTKLNGKSGILTHDITQTIRGRIRLENLHLSKHQNYELDYNKTNRTRRLHLPRRDAIRERESGLLPRPPVRDSAPSCSHSDATKVGKQAEACVVCRGSRWRVEARHRAWILAKMNCLRCSRRLGELNSKPNP